jgi:hypothetical protein
MILDILDTLLSTWRFVLNASRSDGALLSQGVLDGMGCRGFFLSPVRGAVILRPGPSTYLADHSTSPPGEKLQDRPLLLVVSRSLFHRHTLSASSASERRMDVSLLLYFQEYCDWGDTAQQWQRARIQIGFFQ